MNRITCIEAKIYRNGRADRSNHGLSTRFDTVLIPVPDGPIPVDLDQKRPENLCRVVRTDIFGVVYVHVEPYDGGGRATLYGGTVVDSSDARFREAVNNGGYPVHLHDRFE